MAASKLHLATHVALGVSASYACQGSAHRTRHSLPSALSSRGHASFSPPKNNSWRYCAFCCFEQCHNIFLAIGAEHVR